MSRLRPRHRTADPGTGEGSAVTLGWTSGLALLVVPWVGAGILATLGSLVGRESWQPERTFPWLLLVTGVACVGWLVYGSLRLPGFRRGALPGAAIAVALIAAVGTAGLVLG